MLITAAICLPSLYGFACLSGSKARLSEVSTERAGILPPIPLPEVRGPETLGKMELFQIKAEISAATTDVADNLLLELGVDGWSVLEDAIAKRAWVVGIFEGEEVAKERWALLEPLLTNLGVVVMGNVAERPLGDRDWKDSYQAHFHAWRFGRLHWVPVWERPIFVLPAGDAVLWLDPGLAFGTGNHETTRLCVERLVEVAERQGLVGRVIDAGCGSGILALSAALLGFHAIAGFDSDAEAVRVSEENAALNGLSDRVEFFSGDLTSGLTGREADVLLANIQADVLVRFAAELVAAVRPGGHLVLSGILAMENASVWAALAQAAPGWTIDSRVMGEWSDLVLVRPTT